jgi:flap endonuclease-1
MQDAIQAREDLNLDDPNKKPVGPGSVKITNDMINDIKYLLGLLGVPYVDSPSEAEAQCAALVKAGKAYAVASEDMDALAFGTPILLRGFGTRREPLIEISLDDILDTL